MIEKRVHSIGSVVDLMEGNLFAAQDTFWFKRQPRT